MLKYGMAFYYGNHFLIAYSYQTSYTTQLERVSEQTEILHIKADLRGIRVNILAGISI
jgi:hypothetical protein